jgi:hypothetical protein
MRVRVRESPGKNTDRFPEASMAFLKIGTRRYSKAKKEAATDHLLIAPAAHS